MTRTGASMALQMLARRRFTLEQIEDVTGCTDHEIKAIAHRFAAQIESIRKDYADIKAIYDANLERTKLDKNAGRPPIHYLRYEIMGEIAKPAFQTVRYTAPHYHEIGGIAW